MGKYDPLTVFLRRNRHGEVRLSFRDIERIIGDPLPKAAADQAWWHAKSSGAATPQQRAWTSARFTAQVDLKGEAVRFVRRDG